MKQEQICSCAGCEAMHTEKHNHSHAHGETCGCAPDTGKEHSHDDGCGCGHDHEHSGSPDKIKRTMIRVGISIALALPALLLLDGWMKPAVFLLSYLVIGYDVVLGAVKNLMRGKMLDENFLMSIATVGAFCIGEYLEGIAVMLFFQVGEMFQGYAVGKSRKSITDLMEIKAEYANVKGDGGLRQVPPEQVVPGDIIVIRAGEKIPLDGVVRSGNSAIDMSALTGESVPRETMPGSDILSGSINLTGLLEVEVTKAYQDSTVSRILDMVENAGSKKAVTENFITRFARYYTPAVVGAAVLLALLPPLFGAGSFSEWIYRALSFLVVSCPCALVISVPLSFFGGIGGASKRGILVKGSNYLEALSKTGVAVFDKTGTLTKGRFSVTAVYPAAMERGELLAVAAASERFSNHPISRSIVEAYGRETDEESVSDYRELAGFGISAVVSGKQVLIGNEKLMKQNQIAYIPCVDVGSIAYVSVDGVYAGCIVVADEVKPDAKQAIALLKEQGVTQTVMLTGDTKAVAENVRRELGINKAYAGLLPDGKVKLLEKIQQQKPDNKKLVFAGDGINDAPVLAMADVGIAMGGLGSDAAIEAADVVIMTDEPSKIVDAVKIARRTMLIVKQNIAFALGVKAIVLILAAFGISSMWEAVFADVGVSLIAVLNASRALRVSKLK